jgi:hypothetical protein
MFDEQAKLTNHDASYSSRDAVDYLSSWIIAFLLILHDDFIIIYFIHTTFTFFVIFIEYGGGMYYNLFVRLGN